MQRESRGGGGNCVLSLKRRTRVRSPPDLLEVPRTGALKTPQRIRTAWLN